MGNVSHATAAANASTNRGAASTKSIPDAAVRLPVEMNVSDPLKTVERNGVTGQRNGNGSAHPDILIPAQYSARSPMAFAGRNSAAGHPSKAGLEGGRGLAGLSLGPQNYQALLYRRALHPRGFALKGRQAVRGAGYSVEAWIMPFSHLMRFCIGGKGTSAGSSINGTGINGTGIAGSGAPGEGFSCCELVTDREDGLPVEGAVASLPCDGEQEFEHRFEHERVAYSLMAQTETLSESLYNSTYDEMEDFIAESKALVHRWTDPRGGKNLSILEITGLNKEVHAESYHLTAATGLVLRTQTIFSCK